MRLRDSLVLLSAAAALPVIAFALAATFYVLDADQNNLRTAALGRNRAAMSAADSQVRATINTLRAISATADLRQSSLASFHAQIQRVLAVQPGWRNILVQRPNGEQVLNARLDLGRPLPDVVDRESFDKALTTKEPAAGQLSAAPSLGGEMGLAVRLPVFEDDYSLQYVLTAVLDPQIFQDQLLKQKLPEGWASGLVDANGRLIARVPPVPVGTLASVDYRRHIAVASEGWYRGKTVEGADTFTSFLRSDLTGWAIGYAIPAAQVVGGLNSLRWLVGVGILGSLTAAAVTGLWLMTRLARNVERLVDASAAIGSGTLQPSTVGRIEETRKVHDAMVRADQKLWGRSQEIEAINTALRQKAAEVERADSNKSKFLATLAHELRNPLAPLSNGLAILERLDRDGTTRRSREMMERQVALMKRLIDDLLDVSRIDQGRLALKLEALDLEEVLAGAIETVQPVMDAKQQQLRYRRPESPVTLLGDRVRLTQVVANLLNNASKFSPEQTTVDLVVRAQGNEAVITVQDQGQGFPPEQAGAIFELFAQLKPHVGGPGLGIGLSLVRSIVEMHGGHVGASSPGEGCGATFEVHLPLRTDATAAMAHAATPAASEW